MTRSNFPALGTTNCRASGTERRGIGRFLLLAILMAASCLSPAPPANAQSELAVKLYRQGEAFTQRDEHRKALPYLEEAVREDPDYGAALVLLGVCRARTGRVKEAVTTFEKAAQIEPANAEAQFGLAEALRYLNENQRAVDAYQTVLKLKYDRGDAYYGLGLTYLAMGEISEARRQMVRWSAVGGEGHQSAEFRQILDFVDQFPVKYPRDEAMNDPSLVAFRAALSRAVHDKDVAALLKACSPEIDNGDSETGVSYGKGLAAYRRRWNLPNAKSQVWTVLTDILAGGGRWEKAGSRFVAPYMRDGISSWSYLHGGVVVRTLPSVTAPAVGTFSRDVVIRLWQFRGDVVAPPADWDKIIFAGGKQGFVRDSDIASLYYPFTATFEKVKGKWRMTSLEKLISGDL